MTVMEKNKLTKRSPMKPIYLLVSLFFSITVIMSSSSLQRCPCGGSVDPADGYHLEWKVVGGEITISITCKALAWVGIGFHQADPPSDEYKMVKADMVVAVFDGKGKGVVQDYWSKDFVAPSTDVAQGGKNNILSYNATQDLTKKKNLLCHFYQNVSNRR